jgi:UDP-N-acetylmuramoyl-L-alanyl-D-glutamate--2,6-diaminopimelate ligase
MALSRLAEAAGRPVTGCGDPDISDIVFDSRDVTEGALFVALRGGYVDGHDFVPEAIRRGAAGLLVDRPGAYDAPAIVVDDSRKSLSGVSAEFFGHPSRQLNIIGVTGTDGKTSTSTLAEAMLSSAGFRTGLIGTVSIKIGDDVLDHETRQTTPESSEIQRVLRRMVDQGVEWCVLEATSHGLEMHRLDHVRFAIAAVTNITHEHLDFHGSRDAYLAAKTRLFHMTGRDGGRFVVNLDDEGSRSVLTVCDPNRTLTYSMTDPSADLVANDISLKISGFISTFHSPYGITPIKSPLLGGFNVANSLCAAGIALSAGVGPDIVAATLADPPVIQGRMAHVNEGQPFAVVVDYAHTPASLEKVLKLLRSLNPAGRLIVVSGSAGERDREKRSLQGAVCARLANVSVITSEDPRYEDAGAIVNAIAAGARSEGAIDGESLHCIVDRAEAVAFAIREARPGDTVLLAGKGHERSIIVNGSKIPWDEAAVARAALRDRFGKEPA